MTEEMWTQSHAQREDDVGDGGQVTPGMNTQPKGQRSVEAERGREDPPDLKLSASTVERETLLPSARALAHMWHLQDTASLQSSRS
jgi:hypothetical protein